MKTSEVIALAEKQLSAGILAMLGIRKSFYIRETIVWGQTLTVKFSMEGIESIFIWHFDVDELLNAVSTEGNTEP